MYIHFTTGYVLREITREIFFHKTTKSSGAWGEAALE
jgi:hypothetical protein